MRLLLVALALGLVVAAPASGQVSERERISITATIADVRVSGSGPGSMRTIVWRLWNRSITDRPIGHAFVSCWLIGRGGLLGNGAQWCASQFVMPLGKLNASGVVRNRRHWTLVVTGGSSRYIGAAGTVARRLERPGGEVRYIFTLG
jgi:hypothetical protein